MRCLIVDDDPIAQAILEGYVDQHDDLEHVGTVGLASEGGAFMNRQDVDLVLLDVELGTESGFDLARRAAWWTQIIFVTGKPEYAASSYDYRAADYLLKPIGYRRFQEAIDRARRLNKA